VVLSYSSTIVRIKIRKVKFEIFRDWGDPNKRQSIFANLTDNPISSYRAMAIDASAGAG